MTTCSLCGTPTKNPKYCSRSCAAKHTNTVAPKRKPVKRFCSSCDEFIGIKTKRRVCRVCREQALLVGRTLEEVQSLRKYQKNSRIRTHARSTFRAKHGLDIACFVCGYTHHVEICHRLAISNFPSDATIDEINAIENLVGLCPNHHWEFDNGLLVL